MLSPAFSISPADLWHQIGTAAAPQIIDVRRRDIYESTPGLLPASVWREPTELPQWIGMLDRRRPIVAFHATDQHVGAVGREHEFGKRAGKT